MKSKLATTLVALFLASPFCTALSQDMTISRKYTPIVFKIGELPFVGQTIDSLVLYRYTSADGWQRIPFQIDEVNAANGKYEPEDGITDADDEGVFMPGDLGAKATGSFAPDVALNERWEIEASEPQAPNQKGWVYLFKKTGNEESVNGYMSYAPDSEGAGADTVSGAGYMEGHGAKGWTEDIHFIKDGMLGPDIGDKQKLRVKGHAKFLFLDERYELNEDNGVAFDSANVTTGPVRIFRRVFLHLVPPFSIPGIDLDIKIDLEIKYFPYSSVVSAKNAKIEGTLADIAGIQLVRQSIDFNSSAVGRQFFSDSNSVGISIDGSGDQELNISVPVSPDAAFFAANGEAGMFLNIVEVPAIGNTQQVYFHDDGSATGGTGDGTADTGDNSSYGDFGIQINGDKISGQFSLDFLTYYLEQQEDPFATANQIRTESQNPLVVTAVFEKDTPSAVASPSETPANFILHDAHPNPFLPSSDAMRISFDLENPANNVSLTVYNLLGQVVAKLIDSQGFQSGSHEITWSGRNTLNRAVPAGIYFYALEGRFGRHVRKVLIVR
ncbi:MAG: FlgD immunoglobulin-like domain containing protein [bacterium]